MPDITQAAALRGELDDDLVQELVGDDYVFEKDSLTDNNASDSEEENAPKRRGRKPLSLQALTPQ